MDNNDIDYFFPWVNPADVIWQKQYNSFSKEPFDNERFRDWGLLKYSFRSLAKNMPWLHKVHIIVCTSSQIPDWLNTETVNVILHDSFIPKEFLPTFNSNTIEMFYHNIPWFADRVIYGNDDLFAITPSKPEDFFTRDGKVRLAYAERSRVKSEFLSTVKRTYDMVKRSLPSRVLESNGLDEKFLNSSWFIKPSHIAMPFYKKDIMKVYEMNRAAIRASVTRFRDNTRNINQYMYGDYEILTGKAEKLSLEEIGKYTGFADNTPQEIEQMIIRPNKNWKWLCINDTEVSYPGGMELVKNALMRKFPEKCKYEV